MVQVDKVGFQSANQTNFTAQTQENKITNIDYKKYLTAPNIILGSLATIGVLGMADILLCKGKHINKLTGKGQELEEALTRANKAEENITELETKLQVSENKLREKNSVPANSSGDVKKLEEELENVKNKSKNPMTNFSNMVHWLQAKYIDASELSAEQCARMKKSIKILIEQNYGQLVEYEPKYAHLFNSDSSAHIKELAELKPAIFYPKDISTFIKKNEKGTEIFDTEKMLSWLADPTKAKYFDGVKGSILVP